MAHHSPEDDDYSGVTVLRRVPSLARKPTQDMARYVTVVDGSESGKKLELGLNPISVGRHKDNDLALADAFVSGHHCTIAFEAGIVQVTDLNSTNGTFIDGTRLQGSAAWPDHAALQVGNQVLRHHYQARGEMQRSTQLAADIRHAAEYVASLLPPRLRSGAVTTDWHSAPSTELGGDIFSYHWLDGERFAFYLIDVCGHGVGAALHSVSVSNLLRQRFLPNVDFTRPSEVLAALNRALPMEQYGSMYFTLWYGVYTPARRQLTYASAGHPPGLLFSKQGGHRQDLATENPPIGIMELAQFQETQILLDLPCSLYLYSDGVFEITMKTGDWWSCEAFAQYLQEQVQQGQAQPAGLFQAIRAFTRADRFEDDFSLLRLDFHG